MTGVPGPFTPGVVCMTTGAMPSRRRRHLTGCQTLALPFKLNRDRRHHIPRQKRKDVNWRANDASLRQRDCPAPMLQPARQHGLRMPRLRWCIAETTGWHRPWGAT